MATGDGDSVRGVDCFDPGGGAGDASRVAVGGAVVEVGDLGASVGKAVVRGGEERGVRLGVGVTVGVAVCVGVTVGFAVDGVVGVAAASFAVGMAIGGAVGEAVTAGDDVGVVEPDCGVASAGVGEGDGAAEGVCGSDWTVVAVGTVGTVGAVNVDSSGEIVNETVEVAIAGGLPVSSGAGVGTGVSASAHESRGKASNRVIPNRAATRARFIGHQP